MHCFWTITKQIFIYLFIFSKEAITMLAKGIFYDASVKNFIWWQKRAEKVAAIRRQLIRTWTSFLHLSTELEDQSEILLL